jgi:hypothetical protein
MRRIGFVVLVAIAAFGLACSDDGDDADDRPAGDSTIPSGPIADLDNVADTPFCQTYAELIREVEAYRDSDDRDEEAALQTTQQLHQQLTDEAPDEIRSDVEANNQNVQTATVVGELLFVTPLNEQLSEDIRTYVQTSCSITFKD